MINVGGFSDMAISDLNPQYLSVRKIALETHEILLFLLQKFLFIYRLEPFANSTTMVFPSIERAG